MTFPADGMPTGAIQRVLQEARLQARGDTRVTLALLQGAFLEQCIRLAIAEQPSDFQVEAVHAFCQVAARNIQDIAAQYARASASEERREESFGRLHDAQDQARRFAMGLRNRFETNELTRTPGDDDVETERELDHTLLDE